jgi:ABC-type branched-subunit amino acid transport system substrate-binding protein
LLVSLNLPEHFANDTSPETNTLILPEALASLNFYEGALMAADSLSTKSHKIKFRIIDTGLDSLATVTQLNTVSMKGVDAVVSFLPSSFTPLLARVSNRWAIPLYLFSASNTSLLEKNPLIRLVNPSNYTQITLAASYIAKHYPSDRIITVFRDVKGENLIADLFSSVIDSVLMKSGSCTNYNFKKEGFAGLKTKLSKTKTNVLVIPTSDESFLASILSKVNEEKETYKFTLMGMPAWETFNSVDPSFLQELGATFFNGMYIDTKSNGVNNFRKKFILEYHADPTLAAYMGFDVIQCFYREMTSNNKQQEIRYTSLLSAGREVSLKPVCENCGFETKTVNLLKFGDFEFIPVE